MSRAELLAQLRAAAEKHGQALTELDRMIVAAKDDNASLAEIGNALGINRQTVRGRIAASRRRLAEQEAPGRNQAAGQERGD